MKRKGGVFLRSLIISMILVGVAICGAHAQVVDCSTESLQPVIFAAANNATITVTGTCNENIVVPPTKVGLIINGQGSATISGPNTTSVAAVQILGFNITLKGFTVTGGLDGVWIVSGGMGRIDSCTVSGGARHGITIGSGEGRIYGSTVSGNPVCGISVSEGAVGRIGYNNGWDTVAVANTIQDNQGPGICVSRSSTARIVGNTIKGNGGDGITIDRASQADVAGNTIDDNAQNGVRVLGNSGLNLGNATGSTMFDQPNSTNTGLKNGSAGIRCSLGGYVDGRRGTLKGAAGQIVIGSGCINTTVK